VGALPFLHSPLQGMMKDANAMPLSVHIFSKHLQFLDCGAAGAIAAEMGFAGLDLTVRPNGHVVPETVKTDLPKAVRDITAAGSRCEMITTSLERVQNPVDMDIMTTAASVGVQYFRTNWYKYPAGLSLPTALEQYEQQIYELSVASKKLKITGCYQNHAGVDVGSSFWEVYSILKRAEPEYFGAQFDIRHAMVEGGNSWVNGLTLLLPKIKMIVLKDFRWEKVKGTWTTMNVPIGEGMVDFKRYFSILKKAGIHPPVSLHLEYDLGGAEKGDRTIGIDKKVVFDAMKKDLNSVQRIWQES
jgi:sugar phosphate isomerase/epimerase